jgi:hypothetical protein
MFTSLVCIMKAETENLTVQESIDLITQMIRQTQINLKQNSFYFLLWGWIIAICNGGMYFLIKFTSLPYPYAIWLITIPAWIVTMIHANRQGASSPNRTHLDKINMWLWIALAITICPVLAFGYKIGWLINAVILLPIGLCTFVSGIMLRFKPLLVGGIIFWISGTLCFLVNPLDQYLIGALAMVLGYLIPGYMLRSGKEQ